MEGDEECYEQALLEVQQDKVDPGTWARALTQAQGNRRLTIALYVSFRVQQAEGQGKPQNLETLLGCPAHRSAGEVPDQDNASETDSRAQEDLRLRFMARLLDQGLGWFLMLGLMFVCDSANLLYSGTLADILGLLDQHKPVWNLQVLPLLMIVGAPPLMLLIDTALYALFGNTPGKALFGVQISHAGRRLSAGRYALRNLCLWVLGLGMGLPVLNLIMVTWQYFRLRDGRNTLYDHISHYKVTCQPTSKESMQVSAI